MLASAIAALADLSVFDGSDALSVSLVVTVVGGVVAMMRSLSKRDSDFAEAMNAIRADMTERYHQHDKRITLLESDRPDRSGIYRKPS